MDSSTFLWALGMCLTALGSLIAFIIYRITSSSDALAEEQKRQSKEMASIKYNYLERFAQLHITMSQNKEEIMDSLSQLRIDLEKRL